MLVNSVGRLVLIPNPPMPASPDTVGNPVPVACHCLICDWVRVFRGRYFIWAIAMGRSA